MNGASLRQVAHAREIKPKDAMSSGESPSTEHTSVIVYALCEVGFVMVAIRADAPIIRMVQKIVRKNQPELFIKPCLPVIKMLAQRQGL